MNKNRIINSIDDFEDMDHVRETAEEIISFNGWSDDSEEAYLIKKIFGIAPSEGVSVEISSVGLVDIGIAPLIRTLNEAGFKTLASCSGLIVDHPNARGSYEAYISILRHEESDLEQLQEKRVETILRGVEGVILEANSTCYLMPAMSIRFSNEDDKSLTESFEQIKSNIEDYLKC